MDPAAFPRLGGGTQVDTGGGSRYVDMAAAWGVETETFGDALDLSVRPRFHPCRFVALRSCCRYLKECGARASPRTFGGRWGGFRGRWGGFRGRWGSLVRRRRTRRSGGDDR
eukprot:95441-Prorocentrum_minimum.AAC.2